MEIKIPKPFDVPINELRRNAKNVKHHSKDQIHDIQELIKLVGFKDPIVIDEDKTVWAGHGRLSAAEGLGMDVAPCIKLEGLTEDQKKVFMLMDNKVQEADWIKENVQLVFEEVEPIQFEPFKLKFDNNKWDNFEVKECNRDQMEEDTIPEPRAHASYELGDIFQLGDHRLIYGDAANTEHRRALFDGATPDIIYTDPPYSSGGKQEAGKKGGSIGSRVVNPESGKKYLNPKIKMDDLSTRGYLHLIKNVLYELEADICYMFTDWRMWDWTREALESAEYPVRNMLVWDKLYPGMGIQWRGQHELIAFAKRTSLGGPFHKGNVLNIKRSGNEHHPTEKPLTLIGELITNAHGDIVYDPFLGSGSTLIACEQTDKKCYGMELDPKFIDVIIQRWENLTGKKAQKVPIESKPVSE
jgi:DNA modification methylase